MSVINIEEKRETRMILRRFMKHVTDQNWLAVGLDVLVVIVGIFLGLQVQEWNEDRKNINQLNLGIHGCMN